MGIYENAEFRIMLNRSVSAVCCKYSLRIKSVHTFQDEFVKIAGDLV